MAATKEVSQHVTYQEFLAMDIPEDDSFIYELLNGEIVKYSAPESRHQIISANLHLLLGTYVRQKKSGRVLYAPISMFLDEYSAPQPDLLYVSSKNMDIVQEKGTMGAPDLIIEIVSPGSIIRDRVQKKAIYEKAGVAEYWIVDPKYHSVEIYENTPSGFVLFNAAEEEGTIKSKVLTGFEANMEELFAGHQ